MNIRNVAIIAHVDHGKTTLVDALLRYSKIKIDKELGAHELIMDSNELEKERGITIFSKNAAVKIGDTKVNIIDTPGHADFGGEVERVLRMVDGCLLVVDAKDGPMPQTRFVLKRALALGHRIIVVINKVDLPEARCSWVLDKTFELFLELGASDELADFPVVYASARAGLAGNEPDMTKMTDIKPVFDAIIKHVPAPKVDVNKPLQMLITMISSDNYKGRIATGRIYNGEIKAKQQIMHINREGVKQAYRLVNLMGFDGLGKMEIEMAQAGDIVAIAGIPDITIGETIADPQNPVALPLLDVEQPTVKMTFMVNDSPFAGREGEFTTSRQVKERLYRELENDVALRIEETGGGDWIVSGRGELHLSIFIERMRREGYEFQVSRPQVIVKEEQGKTLVPFEKLFLQVPEDSSGTMIQKIGLRHGQLQNMTVEHGSCYMEFLIPTRGLFGFRSEFLSDTRGMGIMNTLFHGYDVDAMPWKEKDQGSLISFESGETNLYGLLNAQNRGILFMGPGIPVYEGQIVGEHAKPGDLKVNVCKAKALSNMRSRGEGVSEHFKVPRDLSLEEAIEYIGDDELVEITPKNVRLRKMVLNEKQTKKEKKLNTK